jgi:ABC-type transport system substrate-binding protein
MVIGGMNFFSGNAASADEIVLKAAVQDEMKTKNILNSNDVWTSHVLWQSFEGVLQGDPNTGQPVPYILKGFETNSAAGSMQYGLQTEETYEHLKDIGVEMGGFLDASIHDTELTSAVATQHDAIAYYDFNGVFFHDGVQADIMDVIFSYHLLALHPNWYTGIAPLMDGGGLTGNFSTNRWLYVVDVSDVWSNDGDPLTSALRFHITTDYAQLWLDTMSVPIFPQHIWEGTGGGIHADFGFAIKSNGIGVPDKVSEPMKAFDLLEAQGWEPENNEVIGTGMFKFVEFIIGSHAKIETNQNYLTMQTGDLDIHIPYIDSIEFIKYSTPQQASLGLQKGEADIILWSVPPDFIPELQGNPNVAIISNPEPGFFYQAFNMRDKRFGYKDYNQQDYTDVGKPFRTAIAHLIDKKTIVDYYLQGYGIVADGPMTPLSTQWYNASLPNYDFDVEVAKSILDANGLVDGPDADSWRDLDPATAGEQDTEIKLFAPTADYDPIRAQACILIETHVKAAGVNLKCDHQPFGTIVSKIDARDFEMYILGWAIGGSDPDYLYSFFYSGNALLGQNYPGYHSALFDQVIIDSRTETDQTERQDLIRYAQGILVEDLPYNVLYYRKNIEAYRVDRFTGWRTASGGSIFNYWSLMNIKQPSDQFLRATVTYASAVSSNKTETITVTVRDQARNVVKDSTVNITVELGNITVGGTNHRDSWEGVSNVNGQVTVTFEAPYVPPGEINGTRIGINVWATKTDYDDSGIKTVWILAFPEDVDFLSVTIDMKFGDIIDYEDSTEVDIIVKNKNLQTVNGVTVTIAATPTDLTVEPSSGTTANGGKLESIVLTAPKVDVDTIYQIKAVPSMAGTQGVEGIAELTVLAPDIKPQQPALDILLIVAVFSVAAISFGIFTTRRKRN